MKKAMWKFLTNQLALDLEFQKEGQDYWERLSKKMQKQLNEANRLLNVSKTTTLAVEADRDRLIKKLMDAGTDIGSVNRDRERADKDADRFASELDAAKALGDVNGLKINALEQSLAQCRHRAEDSVKLLRTRDFDLQSTKAMTVSLEDRFADCHKSHESTDSELLRVSNKLAATEAMLSCEKMKHSQCQAQVLGLISDSKKLKTVLLENRGEAQAAKETIGACRSGIASRDLVIDDREEVIVGLKAKMKSLPQPEDHFVQQNKALVRANNELIQDKEEQLTRLLNCKDEISALHAHLADRDNVCDALRNEPGGDRDDLVNALRQDRDEANDKVRELSNRLASINQNQ
jgi:chromosome segregation ATPase